MLAEIKKSPEATANDIAEALNISLSTVKRSIKELQGIGVISREGSRKTGRWVVTIDSSEG